MRKEFADISGGYVQVERSGRVDVLPLSSLLCIRKKRNHLYVDQAESLLQAGIYTERRDAVWGARAAPSDFDFGTNDLRKLARICRVQFSDLELEPLGAELNAEARAQAPKSLTMLST